MKINKNTVIFAIAVVIVFILQALNINVGDVIDVVQTITIEPEVTSTQYYASPTSTIEYTPTREILPTNTPSATNTLTNTPRPTATNTLRPTSTNTPRPTATNTPTQVPQQSSCNRISYNINAGAIPDWYYMWGHLERLNPCVILVMSNINVAGEAVRRFPNAIVIHRDWSSFEGEEWLRVPDENVWINRWNQQASIVGADINKKIVRYSTNEPSLYDPRAYVQAEVELLNAAARNGYRVAAGNFAVGTFSSSDIANGVYDSFLRAIQSGNHYLSVHEYTTSALPFGTGQWAREWLLDPSQVQVNSWPRRSRLPIEYWYIDLGGGTTKIFPPYWHILRSAWFTLRAKELGLPTPRIILTEAFWDNLSDIGQPIAELRNRFGLPQYMNDMRGINSYTRVWQFYWPNWSQEEAAYWQLAYMDYIYPSNYLGFAQFTWSSVEGWKSFDMSGIQGDWLYRLHRLLENHTRNSFQNKYGG